MAERRMFAKQIIDSDAFLDMPLSAQALYFHLAMRADDDGFVNSPKKIQRVVGAGDDDAKLLIAKRFLIPFESGVVVIKHWRLHNYIQKDRYKPTVYQEEFEKLEVKENRVYTERIQDVSETDTQIRIEKNSTDKGSEVEAAPTSPWTGANALRRVIFFLADGSAYGVSDERFVEWAQAFPTLDVEKALREAAAKNNAQPIVKRKNRVTVEPYIVNWLIVESGNEKKAARDRKKANGFNDIQEHDAPTDRELMKELGGRNGNLL